LAARLLPRLSRDPCRGPVLGARAVGWTPSTSPLDWTGSSLTRLVKLKQSRNASGALIGRPRPARACPTCIGASKARQPWTSAWWLARVCVSVCLVWKDLALSNPEGIEMAGFRLGGWPGYRVPLISAGCTQQALANVKSSMFIASRSFDSKVPGFDAALALSCSCQPAF
jgi:hypothetical protein